MSHGFVYLLGNKAMPCYYKIGCTERSPHARAAQISAATGVPHPFQVLLYIEAPNFQRAEQRLHQELADFRASRNREFFCFGPEHMNWLWHAFKEFPGALSFSSPQWHRFAATPYGPDDYEETWVHDGGYLCLPSKAPLDGIEVAA
jgi:hypothetical protein